MSETLLLEKIRQDGGTQSRAEIHGGTVARYVEAYSEAEDMPPPVVYHDGEQFWLADGFHRVRAALHLGLKQLKCDVRQGSLREAILFSVGANARHGLPRTPNDKRRGVCRLLEDEEWSGRTDRWIAEKCAVSHPFVAKLRAEIEEKKRSEIELQLETFPTEMPDELETFPTEPGRRSGKDGKTYAPTKTKAETQPSRDVPAQQPRELFPRERKPVAVEEVSPEQRQLLDQTMAELDMIEQFGKLRPEQVEAINRLHARARLLYSRETDDAGEWKLLIDDAVAMYASIDAEQVDAGDELAVEAWETAQTAQEPIGAVDPRIAELETALEQAYSDIETARTAALEADLRLQNAVKANEQLRALVADLDDKLKKAEAAKAPVQPRPVMSFRSFVLEFALLDRQTREDISAYVIEKAPGMAARAGRYDHERDSDYRGDLDAAPLCVGNVSNLAAPLACMCAHARTLAITPEEHVHVSNEEEVVVGKGGVGEKPKKRGAAKRALTTYPDDFAVTDEMRAWAGEKHPSVNLDAETEKFTDHHVAKGSKFLDWPAAWRNWIRRAEDYAPKGGGRASGGQALMVQTPNGEIDISGLPYAAQNDIYVKARDEKERQNGVAMQLGAIARFEARQAEAKANVQRRV